MKCNPLFRYVDTSSFISHLYGQCILLYELLTNDQFSPPFVNHSGPREAEIRVMAGTPSYASIDVHNCITPMRKDDIESLVRCVDM
jgi:hypothetical protein